MLNRIVLLLNLLILLISCSSSHSQRQNEFQQWIQSRGKIKVLNTTAMINDLVKRVGGEHVETLTLIQGELDPHSYQLVKGDDEKLSFADVIFYNGLGLEHGPSLQYYLQNSSKAIALGDHIEASHPAYILYVNDQRDPHIWMDISLWAKTLPFIVEALSEKDPLHAEEFRANAKQLEQEMLRTHGQVQSLLHLVPSAERYLVTSHDAFNYFARAYLAEEGELDWQKRFAAPEGLAPESQLSATDIRKIIDHLKRYQIHILFPESNVSQDSIRKIVQAGQEQGLEVRIACCPLYGDAMGSPGSEGETYLKMMLYNAKMITQHMQEY